MRHSPMFTNLMRPWVSEMMHLIRSGNLKEAAPQPFQLTFIGESPGRFPGIEDDNVAFHWVALHWVAFHWKDFRHNNLRKVVTLGADNRDPT
jgi:hypothetical protein